MKRKVVRSNLHLVMSGRKAGFHKKTPDKRRAQKVRLDIQRQLEERAGRE